MNGRVYCVAPCVRCQRVFSFNPHMGPSTSVVTGEREPMCRSCFEHLNKMRRELNLAPWQLEPDAYDALPEEEL
jgi:hypothetical protein